MSTAAVRRAQTVSRVAMSPGTSIVQEEDSMYSVLNEAKEDLRKEKRAKVSFFPHLYTPYHSFTMVIYVKQSFVSI